MDAYLNLWGGEGYLTCASVQAMAMIGMFEDVNGVTLKYKCLDFADDSSDDVRWKTLATAYNRYHKALFGNENMAVICDSTAGGKFSSAINKVVNNPTPEMTLESKFAASKDILAIGCSEDDIKLNIKEGIYGKPWVGEAYHADSHFDQLYPNTLTQNDSIIVMNCGGYKGGGTAATFIPLESIYQVPGCGNVARYNIIAGPSTQFNRNVTIDYPDAYNGQRVESVDRFDIENVKKDLESRVKSDAVSKKHHDENIKKLNKADSEVHSVGRDYSTLNPDFYMARFIDKIRSDDSIQKVDATFVNMKSNIIQSGTSCNYDITAMQFKPDKQEHQLHITNLLNAVTVKELMRNAGAYTGHNIYSFSSEAGTYNIYDIFEKEDAENFYYFIEFVILLAEYIYPYFNDIQLAGSEQFLVKWALQVRRRFATDGQTNEARYNRDFSGLVKNGIRDFLVQYAKNVLIAFWEINNVSPNDVNFFPSFTIGPFQRGMHEVIGRLLSDIDAIAAQGFNREASAIHENAIQMLAAVSTVAKELNIEEYQQEMKKFRGSGFFSSSILDDFAKSKSFPVTGGRAYSDTLANNIRKDASVFVDNILGYSFNFPKFDQKLKINR